MLDLTHDTSPLARAMFSLHSDEPGLARPAGELDAKATGAAGTAREVFGRLYGGASPADAPRSDAPGRLSRIVHDAINSAQSVEALAAYTAYDPLASAAASAELLRAVSDAVRDADLSLSDDENGDPVNAKAEAQVAALARSAVSQATARAVQTEQAVADLGLAIGMAPGRERSRDPETAGRVRRAVNDARLRRVLELVGRLRADYASAVKTRFEHGQGTPYSVAPGRDVRNLLPVERANLADDGDRGLLALARLRNGETLQYERRTRIAEKRGPFVVLLDRSGSMTGDLMDGAVAVAVAAVLTATSQGRDARVISFDSYATDHGCTGTPAQNLALVESLLRVRADGGTNIGRALEAARRVALVKADVLLLTDGADGSGDAELPLLRASGARLHYVHAGDVGDANRTLRDGAANFAAVSDFLGAEVVDAVGASLAP